VQIGEVSTGWPVCPIKDKTKVIADFPVVIGASDLGIYHRGYVFFGKCNERRLSSSRCIGAIARIGVDPRSLRSDAAQFAED
jgi:hypothetical protein